MKIVIINKYYYLDGGPERYMFGLTEHLNAQGHEVIPFSIAYDSNVPSEYSRYFMPPVSDGSETKINRMQGGVLTKARIALRTVYSFEARKALERLIIDTKPDLVYCLNIVNHISPSIIDTAHKLRVPIVLRLSDYNLVCPSYLCLRKGRVCTECLAGYHRALRYRCVYGSISATACRVAGMYFHKLSGIYGKVSAFVTPAQSLRDLLIEGGFPAPKIHYIPTFVDLSLWTPGTGEGDYILYYGRLSPEKGVHVLIEAYNRLDVDDRLVIVGTGPGDYVRRVTDTVSPSKAGKVEFVGAKSGEELRELVRNAKYVVAPSVCLDNAPNVVYESLASGKPVIASSLGGLAEQVTPETGILVPPEDVESLRDAMRTLSLDSAQVQQLGSNARKLVERENDVDTHVDRLIRLFDEALPDGSPGMGSSQEGSQR